MTTETSPLNRQPTALDYSSPTQFRFLINQLPKVQYFTTEANIPGITLGSTSFETPLKDIAGVGDKVTYQTLDVSFLVDENLNNYKEIHDWITSLGFAQSHDQFKSLQATGADRFPGTTSSTAATGTSIKQPLAEGGIYSCLLYTSPSPRDGLLCRMPSSA